MTEQLAMLKRFEFTALKDKSGSDKAQVPAYATIAFYRQGATLTQAFSFQNIPDEPQAIHVLHPGAIREEDELATFGPGTSYALSSTHLTVSSVEFDPENGWLLWVTPGGAPFSGASGDRLVILTDRPLCYSDALGQGTSATSVNSDGDTGRATGYMRATRFDFIVSISGVANRLYQDMTTGHVHSTIEALDVPPDLQEAVDACPDGGTGFIPSAGYTVPAGGRVLSRPMILRGEPGTKLFAHAADVNQPVIKIVPGGEVLSGLELHHLHLMNTDRPTSVKSGNYGIQCDVPSDGSKIGHLVLEKVHISLMGDDGLHLHALGTNDSYIVFATMRNVWVESCRGHGAYIRVANMVSGYDCYFSGNDLCGVVLEEAESQFLGCAFENNCLSGDTNLMDEVASGQAYVLNSPISRFESCHWEDFATANQPINRRGLTIDGSPCCIVGGCRFVNSSEIEDWPGHHRPRAIYCRSGASGSGVMACTILPNRYRNCCVAIEIEPSSGAALDCIVHPQYVELGTGAVRLPVGVANNGLVVLGGKRATGGVTKGVAIPSVADSSARPAMETGADRAYMLYDLDLSRIVYWDGEGWMTVTAT